MLNPNISRHYTVYIIADTLTWTAVPDTANYDNAFKIQWELFLKHVICNEPFRWSLLEGAKGVQLAEVAFKSCEKRAWVDVPKLK